MDWLELKSEEAIRRKISELKEKWKEKPDFGTREYWRYRADKYMYVALKRKLEKK
jgi:hypothetical protein